MFLAAKSLTRHISNELDAVVREPIFLSKIWGKKDCLYAMGLPPLVRSSRVTFSPLSKTSYPLNRFRIGNQGKMMPLKSSWCSLVNPRARGIGRLSPAD